MDERIKQLAKQARLPACHTSHPVALKRFAELVRQDEREQAEKQQALDKKADNARELGLDYEPEEFVRWSKEKEFFDAAQASPQAEKQEPVAWMVRDSIDGSWYPCAFENPAGAIKGESKPLYAVPQQAEKQEPVAWIQEDRIIPEIGYDCTMTREHPKELGYAPLYTSPPKRDMSTKQENVYTSAELVHEIDKSVHEEIERLKAEIKRAKALAEYRLQLLINLPEKEWVGLTKEEIIGHTCECVDDGTFNMDCAIDFANSLQETLKRYNT